MDTTDRKKLNSIKIVILRILSILFLAPIFLILINSFKEKLYISNDLFSFPNAITFAGLENYFRAIKTVKYWHAFGYSLFISVFSVGVIVLFTSMTASYIARIKSKFTNILYYL